MRLDLWLITYSHYLSFVVNGVSKVDHAVKYCLKSACYVSFFVNPLWKYRN